MRIPEKPVGEAKRLETLQGLNILDTAPEERFDRLTRLAKRLFNVPIAVVSLIDADRQWFKSCVGLPVSETPRDISFCSHTILGEDTFLVTDALADDRFSDNPLVIEAPHIRFYAGHPLTAADGSKLGTLCIIDKMPREMSEDELALLRDLAGMAQQELAALHLAAMDELTDISNRRGFTMLSAHALDLCKRLSKPVCLLYFDLDLFKQINDTFGHAEGDHALVSFANLLKQTFRESDVIARLGGDEFAVLATNHRDFELDNVLGRFACAVDTYNRSAGRVYDLVYSVGVVEFDPQRHKGIAELTAHADSLMYERKQQRRVLTASAAQHRIPEVSYSPSPGI